MTSLTQALSIALSGLQTSTGLIAIASNNITNASTAGYTAKSAIVTSVQYGDDMGGATISSYSRASDQALTNNYNAATSTAGYSGTLNSYMTQVQTILDSTSTTPTLTNDVAQFSAAWSAYAAAPESAVVQQQLVSAGQTLAQDIQSATAQIGTLGAQVQTDTGTDIASLNSDLQQLATVNGQIQEAGGTTGSNSVNLQDQQAQLVSKISSFVSVNVQSRSGGQIALYTTTGQLLCDSSQALQFSYNGSAITDSNGTDVTGSMTGGSIQARLDFTSTSAAAASSTTPGVGVIAKLKDQLSTLVGAFTSNSSAFASAYSTAATAATAAGGTQNGDTVDSNFFTVASNGGSPDPSTFAVNPDLISGTSEIPQANAQQIANTFAATANYTAAGLKANGATYTNLSAAILSSFQQTANSLSASSTTATSQQTYFQTTLSSETGVNIDTELANLVAYQNSYAAAAHVISTVNQMLTNLMSTVGSS